MDRHSHDHFGPVSGEYATFRPSYPQALFEWLGSQAPAPNLAWDCATGTGQAARGLADHFARVIATDASPEQIECASANPNVEFRVARAEVSGLDESSVDLIAVAQALHWLDHEDFFAECKRVLAPDGLLAVWTYGPLRVAGDAVDRIVQSYYHEIVGPYWPAERRLVDSGYTSIKLPLPEIETPVFGMSEWWTLSELLGYLGTWSATSAYRDATGDDPRDLIEQPITRAWRDPEGQREVTWPLTVRACRTDSI